MQRPKYVAISLLAGALLVGGMLGVGVSRARADQAAGACDHPRMRGRLASDLGLTDDQRRTVDSLLDVRNDRIGEAIRPIRPSMDSIYADARIAIRAGLTAEQQLRYDVYLARMDSARSNKKK